MVFPSGCKCSGQPTNVGITNNQTRKIWIYLLSFRFKALSQTNNQHQTWGFLWTPSEKLSSTAGGCLQVNSNYHFMVLNQNNNHLGKPPPPNTGDTPQQIQKQDLSNPKRTCNRMFKVGYCLVKLVISKQAPPPNGKGSPTNRLVMNFIKYLPHLFRLREDIPTTTTIYVHTNGGWYIVNNTRFTMVY